MKLLKNYKLERDGKLLIWPSLFHLRCRYLQLRHFYDPEIKEGLLTEGNEIIDVFTMTVKHTPGKIVSKLYKGLHELNGKNSLYVKLKWEQEKNIQLSESDWYSTCKTQHSSTSSKRWREFVWKTFICFLITPHIRSKQLGMQQHCWRQCVHMDANHSNMVF